MLSVLSGRIVLLVSGWSVLTFKMPKFVGLFIWFFFCFYGLFQSSIWSYIVYFVVSDAMYI